MGLGVGVEQGAQVRDLDPAQPSIPDALEPPADAGGFAFTGDTESFLESASDWWVV